MVALSEICDCLQLPIPSEDLQVAALASLKQAGPDDISFIVDSKYKADAQALSGQSINLPT